jgi:hypothetical protein
MAQKKTKGEEPGFEERQRRIRREKGVNIRKGKKN